MDPQKLSQLDPKLREAYERVMGTTIPAPQAPAQAPVPPAPVAPTPQPQPQPLQPPFSPQPQVVPEAVPAQPASNFVQMNSEIRTAAPNIAPQAQAQTMVLKKKSGIMPVLFVFVGIIFIVIYALFWTKFFNLKLPFLPF